MVGTLTGNSCRNRGIFVVSITLGYLNGWYRYMGASPKQGDGVAISI